LLLGLVSKTKKSQIKPAKKIKKVKPPKEIKGQKRRGRPKKSPPVKTRIKREQPTKQAKPAIVVETKEKVHAKLVLDFPWFRHSGSEVHRTLSDFSKRCMAERCTTGYTKGTYDWLQEILKATFNGTGLEVKTAPLCLSLLGSTIREVPGHEEYFYVEVSFPKTLIKVPQGGSLLQRNTIIFNGLNSFIQKEIRRAVGFIPL